MLTYRGNIGNLMQHWVLCELIQRCSGYWKTLRFVDAYSMAPLATERLKTHWSSELFDYSRDREQRASTYERTWTRLVADERGYPNSAAFVESLWACAYSMVLCENDDVTVAELRRWKERVEADCRCESLEVAHGDWRWRFKQGIGEVSDLLFLSQTCIAATTPLTMAAR
jgi:hypothetical protein